MFTGRVRQVGVVADLDDHRLVVQPPKIAGGIEAGGSVAVAGVCLTASSVDAQGFSAGVVKSRDGGLLVDALLELVVGATVNVEPALEVGLLSTVIPCKVTSTGLASPWIDEEGIGRPGCS